MQYNFEDTISASDCEQQTKTYPVPTPEYSDPTWRPEPSNLTQSQLRQLIEEWLG